MDDKFSYTYSAEKHEEIEKIRRKYTVRPDPDEKLNKLRKLDRSAELPGKIISIIVGVVGTMIFGGGLSLVLTKEMYIIGSVTGLLGLAAMGSAVPICRKITDSRRRIIAPEILRLSEEIEKGN